MKQYLTRQLLDLLNGAFIHNKLEVWVWDIPEDVLIRFCSDASSPLILHSVPSCLLDEQICTKKNMPQLQAIFSDAQKGIAHQCTLGLSLFSSNSSAVQISYSPQLDAKEPAEMIYFLVSDVSDEYTARSSYQKDLFRQAGFLNNVLAVFEFNINRNAAIAYFKKNTELIRNPSKFTFEDMLDIAVENIPDPHQKKQFLKTFAKEQLNEQHKKGKQNFYLEYDRLSNDGKTYWTVCDVYIFSDLNTGDLKGYTYIRNINEVKEQLLTLQDRAEKDEMTDTYNKVTFQNRVHQFLETDNQEDVALLIFDIDNFKQINDSYGHVMGDMVIKAISNILKAACGSNELVARFGGDEFIMFITNLSGKQHLTERLKDISQQIRKIDIQQIKVTVSIGASHQINQQLTYEYLIGNADDALYRSKENGKDQYTIK